MLINNLNIMSPGAERSGTENLLLCFSNKNSSVTGIYHQIKTLKNKIPTLLLLPTGLFTDGAQCHEQATGIRGHATYEGYKASELKCLLLRPNDKAVSLLLYFAR